MEKKFTGIIRWPLAIAVAAALASACVKEEPDGASAQGSRIRFGASTELEDGLLTRTEYSGSRYTVSSVVYERINWVGGSDEIRILSAQATGGTAESGKAADYSLKNVSAANQKSSGSIEPADGNGLLWGSGTHSFFSMYQSPGMLSHYAFPDQEVSAANASIVSTSATTARITGYVPATQNVVKVGNEYKANMNYAYMYSGAQATPSQSNKVALTFYPLVTTFEFTLKQDPNDQMTSKLTKVELSTTEATLTGTFTADLSLNGSGNPVASIAKSGTPGKTVTITLPDGGVVLSSTPIKINILTLPLKQTNLTLTLYFGSNKRILPLKEGADFIEVPACRKIVFNNLEVPKSEWNYTNATISNISLSTTLEKVYGGSATFTVKSYKQKGSTTTREGVAWTAYALKEGSTTEYVKHGETGWPSWLTLSKYSGTGSYSGETVTATIPYNDFAAGTWTDVAPEGMTATLQGRGVVGSASAPRDLSMYNIYGSAYANSPGAVASAKTPGAHTANCYVVRQPGYYCFPIVYGNSFDSDKGNASGVNAKAYRSQTTAGQGYYLNADGKAIQSAYPMKDSNLETSSVANLEAVILWQDTPIGWRIINDSHPDALKILSSAPSGSSEKSCPYVQFYIAKADILPGNIVIAVRDKGKSNKILWSWHIWVTDTPTGEATSDFKIRKFNYRTAQSTATPSAYNNMLFCPLGWTPPLTLSARSTTARTTTVKIVPDSGSAPARTFTITQPAYTSAAYSGKFYSCTFYQWGRKDPFPPSNGNSFGSNSPGIKMTCSRYYYSNANNLSVGRQSAAQTKKIATWIKNPHIFDTSNGTSYPRYDLWNSNNKANTLASSATDAQMTTAVAKTIYDPCPPGFTVPMGAAFTCATSDGTNTSTSGNYRGAKLGSTNKRPTGWKIAYDGSTNADNRTLYFYATGYLTPSGNFEIVTTTDRTPRDANFNTAVLKSATNAWNFDIQDDHLEPIHNNDSYGFTTMCMIEK